MYTLHSCVGSPSSLAELPHSPCGAAALELPKFDFLLSSGLSDASPDEGLIEDFAIEDKAVEQLVGGLLSHYLPDLQRSKQALQELT